MCIRDRYDTCSSTAIISPANDTRVNMSLLFDDFYNFPPDKAQIKGVSLPYQTPAPFDWRDYVFTVTGEAVSYTHLDVYKRQG